MSTATRDDLEEMKKQLADLEGQIAAIHKAQAVIEFDMSGDIITANQNFLMLSVTNWTKLPVNTTAFLSQRPKPGVRNTRNSGAS